jgi:ribosomal-protein-alanine N-acetyltransferase
MKDIKIRRMASKDISEVVLLESLIFPDPWPKAAFLEELNGSNRGVLVAESEQTIVGYAAYIVCSGEVHLTNLAVAPEYRRKSIAKILLNHILEIAKAADCEYIFLDVRPSNMAAISLYRKFGFCELYIRANYYRFPVEDALVMIKVLNKD